MNSILDIFLLADFNGGVDAGAGMYMQLAKMVGVGIAVFSFYKIVAHHEYLWIAALVASIVGASMAPQIVNALFALQGGGGAAINPTAPNGVILFLWN